MDKWAFIMTESAREHLHAMVELADRLICESINETDPVERPVRSLSKKELLSEYQRHSQALCEQLDNLDTDEPPNVDEELAQARQELAEAVDKLKGKVEELNNLRFWMDNMIHDTTDK